MKYFLPFLLLIFSLNSSLAQIGIGTTEPNLKSILDVSDPSKGVLIPRINLISSEDPIPGTKPKSLLVWNSNTNFESGEGFYFWDGLKWMSLESKVNSLNVPGIVPAPTSTNINSYWSTDANGNPQWKRINRTMEYINNFK
jgi:hypothetical protein